ncbi:hypothetical protein FLAG1_07660 [Fusarium langsethiae]|uniref:Uncharacterized protein n=1 Tax=Fusarium langsethiae TaxID=179993 RepID=A0A0M9EU09_FUSLA|nr:hypothetical protein FLAG1_07660 [Fusarium langsethiae]GKU04923.1 unnamed protein product [Fusarium langsethiae]
MLAVKRIVLHVILCCLLTLGLTEEDEKYDPANNFRPGNVTGLGDFYTWVGSYYNATAEVDVEFAYQYLTPSDEVCTELRNFTTTFKYDAILSVLERGTWNGGNNSVIFWLTLMPQTSSPFNVSSLPQDFMYKSSNLSFPIYSADPTPGGYWRPHKAFPDKFNFTTTQVSSGAYSLNGTVLNNGDGGSASGWGNVTMPTCNSTEWTNDYRFSMTSSRSYIAEDWDDYKYPEVSMQFDEKTANLTVDGIFYAKPHRQSNMTGQPVGGVPEVVGFVSVRFAGVVDEYHSDALSLNESTPLWERTVGFESNPSNIGYGESDSSAGKMVSGSILTFIVVTVTAVAHAAELVNQAPLQSAWTQPPSLEDRAVTSFHTIVSTSYPQNRWSIGYGKIEGKDGFYTAACVDGLFAVSGIWAGCGDLIFTRCVGATAFARSSTVSWQVAHSGL